VVLKLVRDAEPSGIQASGHGTNTSEVQTSSCYSTGITLTQLTASVDLSHSTAVWGRPVLECNIRLAKCKSMDG
jgi:hypothetical protein